MSEVTQNFVSLVGKQYYPEPEESVFDSLFNQYERVVFQSLITSFGLDSFIQDRVGGDVDTVHNVREGVEYKNKAHEQAYENRGAYNSTEYHQNPAYIETNRRYSEQRKSGQLNDAYTGEKMAPTKPHHLDHTISAKEIHEDRGRVLSGLNGVDLANSPENLNPTNARTNQTKKADSMDDFLKKRGDEYTPEEQARMRKADEEARASYNRKINMAYYTSKNFWTDTGSAAAKASATMGLRQALGFIITEVWFSVKDALADAADDFGAKLNAIAEGIKRGFESAKKKFRTLIEKFNEGAISGVLSSLSTTLCNIFFTTAKNVGRIIRQTWVSIVEATKILIFNPDNLSFSERMRVALKIIATGASVVLGTIVQEAVHQALTPSLGVLPGLGDTLLTVVSSFAGSLCTGFLTVSLLYLIDSDPFTGFLTKAIDRTTAEYKRQARLFEEHAAKLKELDIDKFEQEAALYLNLAMQLETARDDRELNSLLKQAMERLGIPSPWGNRSLDGHMRDPNSVLVFDAS